MPLMTWDRKFSVGVQVLDEDHQKLMALVNELHDGVMSGKRQEALEHVLDQLIKYTQRHFAREEEFFARTQYAQAAEHKKEHDELVKAAVDLQTRSKAGATCMLSMETMTFLKTWLSHHIQEVDKKYGPYLNSKGIR